MRRLVIVLLVVSILPALWLLALLSGYGMLMSRVTFVQGMSHSVTCNYLRATGIFPVIDYDLEPASVVCPQFVRFSAEMLQRQQESRWAAELPIDRPVEVECRFFQRLSGADDGVGMRFGRDAPLRLTVQFNPQRVELLDAGDRSALGQSAPLLDNPPARASGTQSGAFAVRFEHGALPIFNSRQKSRLTLVLSAATGRAGMMLLTNDRLQWVREGGCRPRT